MPDGNAARAPRKRVVRKRKQPASHPAKKARVAAEQPEPRTAADVLQHAIQLRDTASTAAAMAAAEAALRSAEDAAEQEGCAAMEADDEAALERAAGTLSRARELLCLFLLQDDARADGTEVRKRLRQAGCLYKLSPQVLRYALPEPPAAAPGTGGGSSAGYVYAADGVLPPPLLKQLREAFAPGSCFWTEHGYGLDPPSPYFSYRHTLADKGTSAMDCAIRLVHDAVCAQLPKARGALYAEWWAHCRPHPRGHQMHFDADNEGRGGVRNPIVNTILYLSDGVGGPTVVTDQRHGGDRLATRGWLVYPRTNRVAMYPADVLHGVVPGRGEVPAERDSRRVTLMIAFWGETGCKLRPSAEPGASRPYPVVKAKGGLATPPDTRAYRWPLLLQGGKQAAAAAVPVAPVVVDRVWDDVDEARNKRRGVAVQQLDGLPHYDSCFQF